MIDDLFVRGLRVVPVFDVLTVSNVYCLLFLTGSAIKFINGYKNQRDVADFYVHCNLVSVLICTSCS